MPYLIVYESPHLDRPLRYAERAPGWWVDDDPTHYASKDEAERVADRLRSAVGRIVVLKA